MVKIIEGNLFYTKADIIAHQVNCKGVMGSGVAKQVKEKFPYIFENYKDYCKKYKSLCLGEILLCNIKQCPTYKSPHYIANLFGQDKFGLEKQHTDLSALKTCFDKLNEFAKEHSYSIAMPYRIASDRGGAKWEDVSKMIEDTFPDVEVELWKLAS